MPGLAPTDISLDRFDIFLLSAGAVVGRLTVEDEDSPAYDFTLSDNRFEVLNGYLKLKSGISISDAPGTLVPVEVTANDVGTGSVAETFNITVVDPTAGLPVYATATSGDDVFTLGGNQYATARGGNGDDTYIILPTLTNNASIFDIRGSNTIVFQKGVELVAGDETPGVYYLHLGNGATLEINNAEGHLFQIGDGPALSFDDFKTAIAPSPTVDTTAAAVHGTRCHDQALDSVIEFLLCRFQGLAS